MCRQSCKECSDYFWRKLSNGKDKCPRCGRRLDVVFVDDFVNDAIIVRHMCHCCSVMFNPDGTTEPCISACVVEAVLETTKESIRIMEENIASVVSEAERIIEQEA